MLKFFLLAYKRLVGIEIIRDARPSGMASKTVAHATPTSLHREASRTYSRIFNLSRSVTLDLSLLCVLGFLNVQ